MVVVLEKTHKRGEPLLLEVRYSVVVLAAVVVVAQLVAE
jgi:hypothetical protein